MIDRATIAAVGRLLRVRRGKSRGLVPVTPTTSHHPHSNSLPRRWCRGTYCRSACVGLNLVTNPSQKSWKSDLLLPGT